MVGFDVVCSLSLLLGHNQHRCQVSITSVQCQVFVLCCMCEDLFSGVAWSLVFLLCLLASGSTFKKKSYWYGKHHQLPLVSSGAPFQAYYVFGISWWCSNAANGVSIWACSVLVNAFRCFCLYSLGLIPPNSLSSLHAFRIWGAFSEPFLVYYLLLVYF